MAESRSLADDGAHSVRAGAATAAIELPPDVELGGYAARVGTADDVLDPLYARSIVLEQHGVRCAIVSLDILFATRDVTSGVRQVAEPLGIEPTALIVSATHTHSGPAALTVGDGGDVVARIVQAAGLALNRAAERLQPAMLKAGSAPVAGVSANRRIVGGPVDDRVRVICAERVDSGQTIAVLFNYSCHPTVLEANSLAVSADYPGAACSVIEAAVSGVAIFLQGCAGDTNPVWLEHSHAEVQRIGGIVGHTVATLALQLAPLGRDPRTINLRLLREHSATPSVGERIEHPALRAATTTIELDVRPARALDEFAGRLAELERIHATGSTGDDAIEAELAELRMHRHFFECGIAASSLDVKLGDDRAAIDVGVLALDDRHVIVWLPGEPLGNTAVELQSRLAYPDTIIAGYSNGAIGYLPSTGDYALRGYEVGSTLFPVGAAESLIDGCLAAARTAGVRAMSVTR